MEALVFFFAFALYIFVGVLLGGGESAWDKQKRKYQTGSRLREQGKREEARLFFLNELKFHPYDGFLLVGLGELALEEGNPDQALAYAQKALKLESTVAEPHLLLSKGLHAIGEFDLAMLNARKASWFGRKHAEANRWYGLLLLESGEVERGMDFLEAGFNHEHSMRRNLLLENPASPTKRN